MADNAPTVAVDERKILQGISTLKPRRQALLTALATGKSVADSSRFAGYSKPKQGSEALADIRKKLPELMEAMGMSTAEILKRVRKKWDAQKTVTASWNGEITDIIEVDDNSVQMDAIKLSLRLHGLLSSDAEHGSSTLNIQINNVASGDE
jgi:hypothetical protein